MKFDNMVKDIKEGTWAIKDEKSIESFIADIEKLKKKYYNKVGDDEVYDGLDAAISRLEDLKQTL